MTMATSNGVEATKPTNFMIHQRISRNGQFHIDDIPPMLSNILEANDWATLLDAGCGDGSLLHALNQEGHLSKKSVYALDVAFERLQIVQEINKDLICVIGSACDIPVADNSIDLFVSTQVIEHVLDDDAMVKEIRRILTDDGTVYLSTVFKKPYGWYFYRNGGRWVLDPTHLREYSQDYQLLDIFKKYDFDVLVNKKTLDGRPVIDSVIRRLGGGRRIYGNRLLKQLRSLRVPIPGYYNWEIVCKKK